ncbi:glycosyl transferase family 1 [Levilactobacillus huananensis]|uniref:glycosyl transferase family 1 n=1 Tax=Levilactobacillus huananensis TaxID=2486019 RepID=UPI000F76B339|nr:glycosyl transferase family 1 [Levilactobacillus huananensis]
MKKALIKRLKGELINQGNLQDPVTGQATLVVSISDKRHRAGVTFVRAESFKKAWIRIEHQLNQIAFPSWVRVETIHSIQQISREKFAIALAKITRANFWRRGVSFDEDFQTALLEMEINGHEFFESDQAYKVGKTTAKATVNYAAITEYLTKRDGNVSMDIQAGDSVWVFATSGVFTDGNRVWRLEDNDPQLLGVRQLADPKQELADYVGLGETYLKKQIKDDGQFVYGYFPSIKRVLSNYNSVRHFSSIYALLEAITFTKRPADLKQARHALQWGLDHLTLVKDEALFVVEQPKEGEAELKLGAQAMLILALCKYQEVTHEKRYEKQAMQAFRGIEAFRQPDGRFNHVLRSDLSVKNAFRIIYYEGEIAFAMSRLYALTHDDQVKIRIQETLDFMVAHDYGKNHDHWIAYAINEALGIFGNNRDYMIMGLKNAFEDLENIEHKVMPYPTRLELLTAAVKMTDTIRATGNGDLLEPYDVATLRSVWQYRAEYELLSGSFFPEVAMYFYHPAKLVGGFYARNDHFRTRIDDCEHFLSGLINYYDYKY